MAQQLYSIIYFMMLDCRKYPSLHPSVKAWEIQDSQVHFLKESMKVNKSPMVRGGGGGSKNNSVREIWMFFEPHNTS